jgi:hypothetical protein
LRSKQRQAKAKAAGARRIDVTLDAKALDDYATVRFYLKGLNRVASERNIFGFPIRLSDSAIIRLARDRAAADMREEDDQAAKAGRLRVLGE